MTGVHDLDLTGGRASATTPMLLQSHGRTGTCDLLDPVAARMASALQQQFASWGTKGAAVAPEAASEVGPAAWRAVTAQPVFWQFRLAGFREPVELAASRLLVLQLLDLHYGGTGSIPAVREQWSSAELHFANRMGRLLGQALGHAWAETSATQPEFTAFLAHPPKAGAESWSDPVNIQRFWISGMGKQPPCLAWAFAASDLDHMSASEAAGAAVAVADNGWLAALHRSLAQVSVPVRSVLARPEVNLGRMLALQVGDVIPLKMPRYAPISVAGYSFASGSVGEANGRAAICIEQIRKGTSK